VVEEVELHDDFRMRYTKVAGDGPDEGWVTVQIEVEKHLLIRMSDTRQDRWSCIDFSRHRTQQAEDRQALTDDGDVPDDIKHLRALCARCGGCVHSGDALQARRHMLENRSLDSDSSIEYASEEPKTVNTSAGSITAEGSRQEEERNASTLDTASGLLDDAKHPGDQTVERPKNGTPPWLEVALDQGAKLSEPTNAASAASNANPPWLAAAVEAGVKLTDFPEQE